MNALLTPSHILFSELYAQLFDQRHLLLPLCVDLPLRAVFEYDELAMPVKDRVWRDYTLVLHQALTTKFFATHR